MISSTANVAFVAGLAHRFQELRDILAEHLQDNNGEVLSHILISDYLRRIQTKPDETWVKNLFEHMEEKFSGGRDSVSELISVSFIEHILPEEDVDQKLMKHLGHRMRKEHSRIFG